MIFICLPQVLQNPSPLLPTKLGVIFLICQAHLVPLILSQICSLPLEHDCPTWGDTLKNYLSLSLLFPRLAAVSNRYGWDFMTISHLCVMVFHFCGSYPYCQNYCKSYVQLLCCILNTLLLCNHHIRLAPGTFLPLFPS